MTGAIFPDCSFPDDCECAKRGYAHETDRCQVPRVVAAMEELRASTRGALGGRVRVRPMPHALPNGSVMLVGKGGDLADDACEAIYAIGSQEAVPLTPDDVRRILRQERIIAGLRAEAGVGHSMSIILHTHSERLASNVRAIAWLVLMHVGAGDAVFWQVNVSGAPVLWFATQAARDVMLDLLRRAAGGPSTEVTETPAEVPTDDQLRDLERM